MKVDLDEGGDYLIRLCIRTDELSAPVKSAVAMTCDICETPVWYDPNQKPPPGAPDWPELVMCFHCGFDAMGKYPESFINRKP